MSTEKGKRILKSYIELEGKITKNQDLVAFLEKVLKEINIE
jgi:hypothetical protein